MSIVTKIMVDKQKIRILVVLGPTAVGKSALVVGLAKRFGGEVISADSRQVYRGLNIGTGKITRREMGGVRHHLLDVASANTVGTRRQFTVEDFRRLAEKAINEINGRGKVPIVCGGTGFYIQALIDGTSFPGVPPDLKLRKKLAGKNAAELFKMLSRKDPRRAASIDRHNPRRLIRALEIVAALGAVPALPTDSSSKYKPLFIGLHLPPERLKKKINARLQARIRHGMIAEAKRLHASGLTYSKMESLGLEYRSLARYLRGIISKQQMTTELENSIWHYAKRQMSWFKRDRRIHWYSLS